MATKKIAFSSIETLAAEIGSDAARVISLSGLTSISAKAYVLTELRRLSDKNFVVITDSNTDAEIWECDLKFWTRNLDSAISLPSFETDVYSGVSPHAATEERRALALWQLIDNTPPFFVLSARALISRTPPQSQMREAGARLRRDAEFAPELLVEKLAAAGYVRQDPVGSVGEFSMRGGIVDVWSPTAESPARIEFYGDTVESIRVFDPETQLSTGSVAEISIPPMREFAASPADLQDWATYAREAFAEQRFARNLKDRTDFAEVGEQFSGWEFQLPLIQPLIGSAFDYFGDAVLVIDEPPIIERALAEFYDAIARRYEEVLADDDVALEPEKLFIKPDELRRRLGGVKRFEMRALGAAAAKTDAEFSFDTTLSPDGDESPIAKTKPAAPLFLFPAEETANEVSIDSRPTLKFRGDIHAFADELKARTDKPSIVIRTHGLAERLSEMLAEYDASVPPASIVVGDLSSGFEMSSQSLVIYTEIDVFGETQTSDAPSGAARAKARKSNLGAFISDFRDLKSGDYVVHVDHGLGRFDSLQTLSSGGAEREFMLLIYADDAKLFVPVERMDLVSRYSSGEAAAPTLDRLGGLGWQKTKAKAKRAMRDMADELLRLYAERKLVQGYAFSPDAPWQHEFEDAFPFELTTDQAAAIEDVKADMETPRPMDRLIVGDVGYGKTEVAMRAAFKAVMDGRQVAVLTPTTILAYQHFESFRKRFSVFPARIDLLSRFRTQKEQKSVAEAAEKGDIDVLIGTHRVLSSDVKLPKLGLVVVDEEQRFGVAHKEKLKQLKKKVDVLTLSATPIPRTLNMSLLGMRDMSVIETPPRDRLAINTQVVQFSESVVRSAVELELARNGQVFFIHNRVETIESIAALVQKIVPSARVAIGHGQMNEKEMEQVMLDFIDYKYDILVATTIIENGIDIPRANTIIINRADNYGLSQLYQLRGRVGRSNRRAYAYLLIPSELELTPIARRRLSAIREFSDLGAGFRIAALDLELRGAGNILGGQQSGHLDALGFDLYTKMLERTIAEIRGDEITDETSVSINLGIDLSIPKDYIPDASQRLRTYKRISSAENELALSTIKAEIEDRYGKIPPSVDNLFEYRRLRRLAESLNIASVDRAKDGVAIKLTETSKVSPDKLRKLLEREQDASFSPSGILRIARSNESPINAVIDVLGQISNGG